MPQDDGKNGTMSEATVTASVALSLEERLRKRFGEDVEPFLEVRPAKKLKPGFFPYELTMMDRNLLVGAGRAYVSRKENRKGGNHDNLLKLSNLVGFQETLDYYAMVEDVKRSMLRTWNGAWMRYNRWSDWKAGLPVKVEASLEGDDGVKTIIEPFDPSAPAPEKPSVAPPTLPKDEERGPSRTFHIPAILNVWIIGAIKVCDWNILQTENSSILRKIFGIEGDKDKKTEEEEEVEAEAEEELSEE